MFAQGVVVGEGADQLRLARAAMKKVQGANKSNPDLYPMPDMLSKSLIYWGIV
jgi:hypothetical protein